MLLEDEVVHPEHPEQVLRFVLPRLFASFIQRHMVVPSSE
jgi:hypothetical protein